MCAVAEHATYTPDDLLALPDEKDYELVDGRLVERHMGAESSWIAARLSHLLYAFLDQHALGLLFGADVGVRCFADDPNRVRKPDVSFVRNGRLPDDRPPPGYVRVAPDLAVEVVSPNDVYSDVSRKVAEYLRAGVAAVWVVDPPTRVVLVYRADGTTARFTDRDELTGGDVLPGFRCRVADLFPKPTATATGA